MTKSAFSKSATVQGGEGNLPPFYSTGRNIDHKYVFPGTANELFKDHDDRIAVILGSGSSLRGFDFSVLDDPLFAVTAINDEVFRNKDSFKPEIWMFFDNTVADRFREYVIDPDIMILSKENMHQELLHWSLFRSKPVPRWLHRLKTFKSNRRWDINGEHFYMNKTTAVPALCLAIKRGFKKIILLGVDFYSTSDCYYYIGEEPKDKPERAKSYIDDNQYMEDRHVMMVSDMTQIHKELERANWDGKIFQTSMLSPLSCFEKAPWESAINHLKKSG